MGAWLKMVKQKLYRLDQTAEMLNVSVSTVRRLVHEGELISHSRRRGKQGMRITAVSVDNYIERYTVAPEHVDE